MLDGTYLTALARRARGSSDTYLGVYHCTFVNGGDKWGIYWDEGFSIRKGYLNINIVNNIFHGWNWTTDKCALLDGTDEHSISDITILSNLFGVADGKWPCTPGACTLIGFCTEPMFRDPANQDYHLSPFSPAVDAASMGTRIDFDGESRPFGPWPDIGFDEVTVVPLVDVLRAECASIDPLSPSKGSILPLDPLDTPAILSGLTIPGAATDPQEGILTDTGQPLVFYSIWPEETGNCLRVEKDMVSESVRLTFNR